MKNRFVLLIGVLVVLVLVAYTFCFQVRYDQVAVKTTFGRATAQSILDKPGLYLRWPPPIQGVMTYDRRVRLLEEQLEQLQTADGNNVIVETYAAWRINDPLQFFRRLTTVAEAERRLQPILRDTREVISEYDFEQLVNVDPGKMALEEIEQRGLVQLQAQLEKHEYGIQVANYGIRRILLPENVTEKVFEQMRTTRQRMASDTRSSGEAEAARIEAEAESIRQRILAFAERRAAAIRAEGDREAAGYYATFDQEASFAIFLRQIEALKEMLAHNTTFVLDADRLSPLDLFTRGPEQILEEQE